MDIFRHKLFLILVGISALLLASVAAYFSVFGLVKLFIGAGIAGVILFSTLELAKIVAVSYLHRYWSLINWVRKTYMVVGVVILMAITSMGIYGFLSAAFQSTSQNLTLIENEVKTIENKKTSYIIQVENIKSQIEFREKRINQLSDIRNQQETRLDTLYQRKNWKSARSTEINIKEANETINTLNNEITELNIKTLPLNDTLSLYDTKILTLNNNVYNTDLGPFKYISNLTNITIDKIVNYLILFIIFVFDPMSIAFLIAFNHISNILFLLRKKDDENEEVISEKIEEINDDVDKIVTEKDNIVEFKKKTKNDEETKKEKIVNINTTKDITRQQEIDFDAELPLTIKDSEIELPFTKEVILQEDEPDKSPEIDTLSNEEEDEFWENKNKSNNKVIFKIKKTPKK